MKKILSILIILLFAIVAIAQDKAVEIPIKTGISNWGTYVAYTANDELKGTVDTIDYHFIYRRHEMVKKISGLMQLDTIAGRDTITYQLHGRDFANSTWTTLINATTLDLQASGYQAFGTAYSMVIPAHNIPFNNPTAETADTLYVPAVTVEPLTKSYREYRLRLIRTGVVSTAGVKVGTIELKVDN